MHQLGLPTPEPSSSASFSSFLADAAHVPSSPTPHSDAHDAKRIRAAPRPRVSRDLSLASSNFSSPPPFPAPFEIHASQPAEMCHQCQGHLSALADCELCGSRTCTICLRTCEATRCTSIAIRAPETPSLSSFDDLGPRKRRVCAKCCEEVGAEGTVWCRVCYADDADLEAFKGRFSKETLQAESVDRVASWLWNCGGGEETDQGYTGDCEL